MYPAPDAIAEDEGGFRRLYDYLVGKTLGKRLPDRRDIDPSELKPFLTSINLLDLLLDDGRFRLRYRLVGSSQSYFFAGDRNVTGHFIDEFWSHEPEALVAIEAEYRQAVEKRAPVIGNYRHSNGRHDYMRYRRAIFPLTNGGDEIAMFLCFHEYESQDVRLSREALGKNPVSRKPPPPLLLGGR